MAGSDYTAASDTLTIPAADTEGTISISIIDDSVGEGRETFTVTLSSPVNATITDDQGIGTIDDDYLPARP